MGSKLPPDELKARIFEDYLRSIAMVQAGQDPEQVFIDHERRVSSLRALVASVETGKGSARHSAR